MTNKSSVSRSKNKPKKPYPDFPLFPNGTRRWAEKIWGKHHYFVPWDDPDAALQKYLDRRDDLHAGRTPRSTVGDLTFRNLCNHFLTSKRHLLDTSELSPGTFRDYHNSCARIVKAFGKCVSPRLSDNGGPQKSRRDFRGVFGVVLVGRLVAERLV